MAAIACNCSSIGQNGKLLIEGSGVAPRTFTSGSKRVEFLYETLATKRDLMHTESITGTTSRLISGVRPKSYMTQGVIALQASPANLHIFLPYILGGAAGNLASGTTDDLDEDGNDRNYPLASVQPKFDALVYRESGIFQYTNLTVAQAMLRGRTTNGGEGSEFIELLLVVVGEQEIITQTGDASPWPVSEPAYGVSVDFLPYAFWELKLFLNETEVSFEEFKLTIDNQLAVKFYNEQYPTCVRSTGRRVSLEGTLPFTCDTLDESLSLYNTQGTAELQLLSPKDDPTFHAAFVLPYARNEFETPTNRNKADLPLKVNLLGFASAGNDELVVTNDAILIPA